MSQPDPPMLAEAAMNDRLVTQHRSYERAVAQSDFEIFTNEIQQRLEIEIKLVEMIFKALVLVNGGALVALFSLVGALGGKEGRLSFEPLRIWFAFLMFSIGLVATLASGVNIYFSQRAFSEKAYVQAWIAKADSFEVEPDEKWLQRTEKKKSDGAFYILWATVAAIAAILGFVGGSAFALWSVIPH